MNPAIGPIFRLLGPLVQVACLIAMLSPGIRERSVAGVAVETLLYAGFGIGFLLVVAGIALSRPASRRPRRPDHDRSGGPGEGES